LYLADELDREGKAQAAASHYNAFLEKIARGPAQNRPAPAQVIAVILRMADCQTRSSQIDRAVKSYQLAEKLAAQTGQAKLASVADVDEAALQVKAGRLRDAMLLYQHALKLDGAIHDSSASAQDWFSYSRFLDEAGFSPRLAYACLVKSQQITQSRSNAAVPESLIEARKQLEKRLGAAAAAVVRRDPEPALQEALALRP
jgi:tetratricopeptide (TPR) repeat protein